MPSLSSFLERSFVPKKGIDTIRVVVRRRPEERRAIACEIRPGWTSAEAGVVMMAAAAAT